MSQSTLKIQWGIFDGVIVQRRRHLIKPEDVADRDQALRRVDELKGQFGSSSDGWSLGYLDLIHPDGRVENLYLNPAWVVK